METALSPFIPNICQCLNLSDHFLLYWDFLNLGRKSVFKADILVKSIYLSTNVISEVKNSVLF